MILPWLLMPAVGALIGWLTNALAITLLFRPRRPVGPGPFRLWGLLPRFRSDLALRVGRLVQDELVDSTDLVDRIVTPGLRDQVAASVARHAAARLRESMPALLPRPLADAVTGVAAELSRRETAAWLDRSTGELKDLIASGLDIAGLVQERLEALNLEELERLVRGVAARELRYIVWLGGLIGLLIGLLQAAVFTLFVGLG